MTCFLVLVKNAYFLANMIMTCVSISFIIYVGLFFFSSRRRHTRCLSDWSSDVCSSDLGQGGRARARAGGDARDEPAGGREAHPCRARGAAAASAAQPGRPRFRRNARRRDRKSVV